MIAKAEAKHSRISPFKVRPVIRLIKGEPVQQALSVLGLLKQKGAYHLAKVLQSAMANAKYKGYEEDKLFISKAVANPGPVLKRYRSASFGRASIILKRSSHILVELDSKENLVAGDKLTKVKK